MENSITIAEWLFGVCLGLALLSFGVWLLRRLLRDRRQKPDGSKWLTGLQLRTEAAKADKLEVGRLNQPPAPADPFSRFPRNTRIMRWHECPSCGWRGDLGTVYKACPVCARLYPNTTRQRVFCASLADVFEDRPELTDWRRDLFALIDKTPNLDWLLLTKRPGNVLGLIRAATNGNMSGGDVLRHMTNVWIGASVENQEQAEQRIPHLLNIPASVRFLSLEPLLGPVDLGPALYCNGVHKGEIFYRRVDWVIVGGESGPNARPMHPDWVRSIRDQCQTAGVPFFFKQWGEWLPFGQGGNEAQRKAAEIGSRRVGKKAAGRLLDGREWNEYPRP